MFLNYIKIESARLFYEDFFLFFNTKLYYIRNIIGQNVPLGILINKK